MKWVSIKRVFCVFIATMILLNATSLMFVENAHAAAKSTLSLSGGTNVPAQITQGKGVAITGTVSSNYPISKIQVGVQKSSGEWVHNAWTTVKPNTKSYNLKNVDSKIKFNTLTPGAYKYVVIASDTSGTTKTLQSIPFKVVSKNTPAKSTLAISGATKMPSTLTQGKGVSVTGTVSSNYSISKIQVGVQDSKGKWVNNAWTTVTPNAKSYDLKKVDSKIQFNSLKPGNYKFVVTATDTSKTTKTLQSTPFTVVSKSTLALSNPTEFPSSITQGKGITVTGVVSSNYPISKIEVGVKDSAGKWVPNVSTTVQPNAKSYDLKNVDSKIKFNTLAPGKYKFEVIATDSSGEKKTLQSSSFTVTQAASTLSMSGTTSIASQFTQGSDTAVMGTVSSNYNITKVEVGVKDSSGKWVPNAWTRISPNTKSYDLKNVDNKINFKTLTLGNYRFEVIATDSSGLTKTLQSTQFNVVAPPTLVMSGTTNLPKPLVQGQGVPVNGVVTSSYPITKIEVGVKNSSGDWIDNVWTTVTPNSRSYDLRNVDSKINFNVLAPGSYEYIVKATDSSGATVTLQSTRFNIAPASIPVTKPLGDVYLGSLSAKYESNGNPGTISSGAGDPGGKSYGAYQLASKAGSLTSFMNWLKGENVNYYNILNDAYKLDGQTYGTFYDSTWKMIATLDYNGFLKLQHDYIQEKYYDVAANKLKNNYGYDMSKHSLALQNVLWSTAVQHGTTGAVNIFASVGLTGTDTEMINKIYDERSKVDIYFKSSSASVKQGVLNRFTKERVDALNMLNKSVVLSK